MNIGILDDHELIRIGIASALAPLPHELTISVASADQFLLDILLPGTSGVDVAKRLRTEYPDIKIIVLSVETREYPIMQLMNIGIDGYISKNAPLEEVPLAINSVMEGVPFYGRDMAVLIRDLVDAKMNKRTYAMLPKREVQIIEACCAGKLGKEIAEEFHISLRAVNSHKTNIFNKYY